MTQAISSIQNMLRYSLILFHQFTRPWDSPLKSENDQQGLESLSSVRLIKFYSAGVSVLGDGPLASFPDIWVKPFIGSLHFSPEDSPHIYNPKQTKLISSSKQ